MQNLDRDHAGATRLRRVGLIGAVAAALALLLSAPAASASARSDAAPFVSESEQPKPTDATVHDAGVSRIELAGNERRGGNFSKPPARGSSAELEGGSSADRYGGSSADRRGVAGRYDPRNRGIRQFQASNDRKRGEHRPKQNEEMDDQDQDPPRDRFSFTPQDPSAARDRSDRD